MHHWLGNLGACASAYLLGVTIQRLWLQLRNTMQHPAPHAVGSLNLPPGIGSPSQFFFTLTWLKISRCDRNQDWIDPCQALRRTVPANGISPGPCFLHIALAWPSEEQITGSRNLVPQPHQASSLFCNRSFWKRVVVCNSSFG